jgi:hypothetical protein
MSSTASPAESPYLRGAPGHPVSGRRAVTVAVAACLITLIGVGVALALETHGHNADLRELKRHGVPVQVTVTNCVGVLSGTGITAAGFTCHGRFSLGQQPHDAVIRGTTALYPRGTTLGGVTSAQHPTIVYTAGAVAKADTSWRRYDASAVLLLCAAAGGIAGAALLLRTRRRPAGQ